MLDGRYTALQMRKEMNFLDIKFDYRDDTSCGDPDADSIKLYEAHKILWAKTLPSNKQLEISIVKDSYGKLLLKNNQYMNFSSDRMCPHFDGKYNNPKRFPKHRDLQADFAKYPASSFRPMQERLLPSSRVSHAEDGYQIKYAALRHRLQPFAV